MALRVASGQASPLEELTDSKALSRINGPTSSNEIKRERIKRSSGVQEFKEFRST
jgi:hypothetical protein